MGEAGAAGSESSLLAWTVASANAALLVAVAVGLLYAADGLGDRLAALDTSIGVLAYGYLWAVTWWTNRRWLDALEPSLLSTEATVIAVSVAALRWGAVAGVLLFAPAFVAVAVLVGGNAGLGAVPFLALGAGIGALLAAGVGAVVGGLLGLVDVVLVRTSRAWLPPTEHAARVGSESDTP